MKKKLVLVVLLSFSIILSLSSIMLAEEMDDAFIDARLIDATTKESIRLDVKNISEDTQTKILDNGTISVTKGYDITFAVPDLPGLTNVGDSGNSNGDLRAYVNMDYDLRTSTSGDREIKVNRCWGGWTIYNSFVVLDKREVYFTDGNPWGDHQSENFPTVNNFNYNVNWGWTLFYPGTNYSGPRAFTSTRVIIPGMGFTGYIFELNLTIK